MPCLKFLKILFNTDDYNKSFHFPFKPYSHSYSKLYQDFLCFNMIYTCNRSLLLNNFLTFSLCINGITNIVGKCMSLSFRMIWISSHHISNMSHIQFFLKIILSKDSSPVNLNKCVFLAILFRSNDT